MTDFIPSSTQFKAQLVRGDVCYENSYKKNAPKGRYTQLIHLSKEKCFFALPHSLLHNDGEARIFSIFASCDRVILHLSKSKISSLWSEKLTCLKKRTSHHLSRMYPVNLRYWLLEFLKGMMQEGITPWAPTKPRLQPQATIARLLQSVLAVQLNHKKWKRLSKSCPHIANGLSSAALTLTADKLLTNNPLPE